MRVSVNYLDTKALQRDFTQIPTRLVREGSKVVRKNVTEGNKVARQIARSKSGPHGTAYYKRITSEMTGPMAGEYGPHDGGIPVGAGFRHGPPNTDLEQSLDVIGPKFQSDAERMIDDLFGGGQ